MIAGLIPYPDYKPSSIEWLGDIPAHWEVKRAKWLFQKMQRPVRDIDEVITCFRDGVVTLRKNRRELGFTESLKEIGYQGVRCGDLVIHAMDAFAGAIGVSDSDGKGTPVYSVCKPRKQWANAYYYAYILREMARNQWIQALAKGIRERSSDFRYTDFASQKVIFPSLAEQTAIVRYLDHADGCIRRYIDAKERLIGLLKEQRQAVIHRAVTRGLNPDIHLKPSGVEWLGNIPAHWEVKRLKWLCSRSALYGANVTSTSYTATGVRFLRTTDITEDGKLRTGGVFLPEELVHDYLLMDGDVLISRSGTIGRSFLYNAELHGSCAYAGYLVRFVPASDVLPKYIFLYTKTQAFAGFLQVMAISSTIENVNGEKYANLSVPVPPLSEQSQILHYLNKATGDIDTAITHARRQIDLLSEYRTRLIADIVTGKLDVREAAARLPVKSDKQDKVAEEIKVIED